MTYVSWIHTISVPSSSTIFSRLLVTTLEHIKLICVLYILLVCVVLVLMGRPIAVIGVFPVLLKYHVQAWQFLSKEVWFTQIVF